MDLNKNKKPAAAAAAAGEFWTEERHARFLNRMEESFVRTMIAGDRGGAATSPAVRLDRHVPDSATESTRDVKLGGGGRAASLTSRGNQNLSFRNHNMTKKRLYPQSEYNPLQDQVVPDGSISSQLSARKEAIKQVAHWL